MDKSKSEQSTKAAMLIVRVIGYSFFLVFVAFVLWRIYGLTR